MIFLNKPSFISRSIAVENYGLLFSSKYFTLFSVWLWNIRSTTIIPKNKSLNEEDNHTGGLVAVGY